MTTPVDLFGPATQSDPHPLFAQLRQESALRRVELPDGRAAWLVTRYDVVRQALRDPALSKGGLIPPTGVSAVPPQVRAITNQHMLAADPPDHTRLRRLAAAA